MFWVSSSLEVRKIKFCDKGGFIHYRKIQPNAVMVNGIALLLYNRMQSWWRTLPCCFTIECSYCEGCYLSILQPKAVIAKDIASVLTNQMQSWWRALPYYFTTECMHGEGQCIVTLPPNVVIVKGVASVPYNRMQPCWGALPCFFTAEYSHSEGHCLVTFRQKCNDFTRVFSLFNKNLLLKINQFRK